jgi:hypothetical protein
LGGRRRGGVGHVADGLGADAPGRKS